MSCHDGFQYFYGFYCFLLKNLFWGSTKAQMLGFFECPATTDSRIIRITRILIIVIIFGFEPTDLKLNRSRSLNLSVPGNSVKRAEKTIFIKIEKNKIWDPFGTPWDPLGPQVGLPPPFPRSLPLAR